MASKNSHRSPILALLLLACVGALGQERQLSVSTPSPATNRLAPSTSASAYLEAVGKGREFLANLPVFRYRGVVLEASQLKYRPHDDVIYPSVVRVDGRIPNAPGKLLFEDDGRLCLFFNIGPRLRNKIALAISESR